MQATLSSGSLSTAQAVKSGAGKLCYIEATGGTVSCYEGSTSGTLLATATSSNSKTFYNPVQFGSTGLWVTFSAGSGVIHYI